MTQPSKKMGRPKVCDFHRLILNKKISPCELKSLERITGLKGAKALRCALSDFITQHGGYSSDK